MNTKEPEEKTDLRPSDWAKDGVGIDSSGQLVIRDISGQSRTRRSADPAYWYNMIVRQGEMEYELREAKMEANGCRPGRFLPEAIAELEKRATEAASMKGDGVAGKIMWGQAQAYLDSIALLKTFFRQKAAN